MSTARDARRALARGDIDFALVLLWNAIEPHRLKGDSASLEEIAWMADAIAEEGDASQAREAARLAEDVRELLGYESAPEPAAHVGGDFEPAEHVPVTVESVESVLESKGPDGVEVLEDDETFERGVFEETDDPQRSKLSGLVWAIIIGAFILLNVLGNFLRD